MPASSASATVRSWSPGAPRTISPPTAPQPKPRIEVLRPVRPNARVSIRAPRHPWGASTRGLVYSIGSGIAAAERTHNAYHAWDVRHVVRPHRRTPARARARHRRPHLQQGRHVPGRRQEGAAAAMWCSTTRGSARTSTRTASATAPSTSCWTANRSASCRPSTPGSITPSIGRCRARARASATAARRVWRSPSTCWARCSPYSSRSSSSAVLQAGKQWQITPFREIWRTNWLIIGFGPIGQEIARRVKAFGATTSVVRRTPQASPLADQVGTSRRSGEVPAGCRCRGAWPVRSTTDTRGMANAKFFAALKQGAVLVNIARGGLIDDAAMLASLDAGRPATAILDVFHEEPLPADQSVVDASARALDVAHVVLGQRRALAVGPAVSRQHPAFRTRRDAHARGQSEGYLTKLQREGAHRRVRASSPAAVLLRTCS